MIRRIVNVALSAALILTMAGAAMAAEAPAEEIAKSATASVSYMSQYVWRGMVLSDTGVMQPSIDFNYGGFNANLWANYDMDSDVKQTNETDLTLKYTYGIGDLSLSAGYIYYGVVGANTEEAFASVSYATLLNPSLTYYQDLRLGDGGGFAVLSVSQSSPELWHGITVGGGASAGYNFNNSLMGMGTDGKKFNGFYNGELSAFVNIPVTKAVSIKPSLAYDFPLSDDAKAAMKTASMAYAGNSKSTALWGGVTVALAF